MTKRRDILKAIAQFAKESGQKLVVKEGGNHTRIWVGERYTTIGRHNEIDDLMAKKIFKQIGIE